MNQGVYFGNSKSKQSTPFFYYFIGRQSFISLLAKKGLIYG